MRNLNLINQYRQTDRRTIQIFGGIGDEKSGAFIVPSKIDGQPLIVIASSGFGWEHVSVSRKNRCPNWPEMCQVRHLFFKDAEVVMELHVAAKDNISFHDYCLHLWRPTQSEIPIPPDWMVGPRKDETPAQADARAQSEMDKLEQQP